jgi:hypothetical protein
MTQFHNISRSTALVAVVAGLAMGSALNVSRAADTAPAPGPASQWVERTLDYTYMGFTSRYSCDGLEDNVRVMLLALGARKSDLKIDSRGCTRFTGPEASPGIFARFWVLAPQSADQTGNAAGGAAQAAQWQTVDMVRLQGPEWEQGQCELLEQMKQKALPLFTSRNLKYHSSCFPHSATPGEIQFTVDVLRPTPVTTSRPGA